MCLFIYLNLCLSAGFKLTIVLFIWHFNENFVIIIIIIIIIIIVIYVYLFIIFICTFKPFLLSPNDLLTCMLTTNLLLLLLVITFFQGIFKLCTWEKPCLRV